MSGRVVACDEAIRRVAVTASATGNGKTTFGHELARRLDVPLVELDALVHGPNWTETPDDVLHRLFLPVLAGEGWVIDGGYRGKIGNLVLERADAVVWLHLPVLVEGVPQRRRRALNSATQAAALRPIQIGVRIT